MTHTIDTILALADAYASHRYVDGAQGNGPEHKDQRSIWAREVLHAALTEALAPQAAQPKGLFVDMIAEQGPEFVYEMAKIGCVQHDCDECKARAAKPVREPKSQSQQWPRFYEWANAKGCDTAHTCNCDTGEWIVFNPMTKDLWKCWQAANGIGDV